MSKTIQNEGSVSRPRSPSIPPLLSPTLPPWIESMFDPLPKRMLSPTLPSMFDSAIQTKDGKPAVKPNKTSSKNGTSLSKSSPQILQPVPRHINGSLNKLQKLDDKTKRFIVKLKLPPQPQLTPQLPARPKTLASPIPISRKAPRKSTPASATTVTESRSIPRDSLTPSGIRTKKPALNSSSLEAIEAKRKRISTSYSSSDSDNESLSLKPSKTSAASNGVSRNTPPVRTSSSSSLSQPIKKPFRSSELRSERSGTINSLNGSPRTSIQTPPPHASPPHSRTSSTNKPTAGLSSPLKVSSSSSPPSHDKRIETYKALKQISNRWVSLAREKKHEGDAASLESKYKLASVLGMDSLLAYIVGFDYLDRANESIGQPLSLDDWSSLVPFISRLIMRHEENDFRILIGLCYQLRALIYLRIAKYYQYIVGKYVKEEMDSPREGTREGGRENGGSGLPEIQSYSGANSNKYSELCELTVKLLTVQECSTTDFKRGLKDLGIDAVQSLFPITWAKRDKSVNPVGRHEGGFRPVSDPFFLPLHTFSSLQEAAAFGYSISKEWADKNKVDSEWAIVKGFQT